MTELTAQEAGTTPAAGQDRWRRLEIRTILVRPFNELLGFLPVLIGVLVVGNRDGGQFWWGLGVVALLLGRGLLHWLTTRYRVTDEQVEVRTGLVFRQRLATRRSRIRAVEANAKFGHRLFGVTAVRIGTGQHDQKDRKAMRLDAVTTAEAESLRRELLRRTVITEAHEAAGPAVPGVPPSVAVIERLDWAWLRYAPLTLSGLFAMAALAGIAWRSINELDIHVNRGLLRDGVHWFEHANIGMVVLVAIAVALVIIVFGSMIVYALKFNGYRLTRESDDTLHMRRGLLTTTAVTIEEARLRGAEIHEPLLLRAGRGARCTAVATGLQSRNESHLLMPPGPASHAHRVAAKVLRTNDSPTQARLVPHSAPALRRRLVRAVVPGAVVVLGLWLAHVLGGWPDWLWQAACALPVLAVPLAVDRYRNLGHALAGRYLVSRLGSFDRRTVALRRDGIIGWQVRRSWFQRRAGVMTLSATLAAGRGAYRVLDITEADGLALADAAVPGLLAPFLVRDAR